MVISEEAWQINMARLRSTANFSATRLACLPNEVLYLFGFDVTSLRSAAQQRLCKSGGVRRQRMTTGQVPGLAMRHMEYVKLSDGVTKETKIDMGTWRREWSHALVEALVKSAASDGRVSPMDYPYAAELHYNALQAYPVKGKSAFVAGSVSPWLEAIVISHGAQPVLTVDYELPTTTSPRLNLVSMQSLKQRPRTMDAVFSYSSIEHDGLGRYGDPLNPLGDVRRQQF